MKRSSEGPSRMYSRTADATPPLSAPRKPTLLRRSERGRYSFASLSAAICLIPGDRHRTSGS